MNKTSYDTRTSWRKFSESSVNTPGFYKKLARGERLPENPYWMHVEEGSSPLSQTSSGLKTERDVRGYHNFLSVCKLGYLSTVTGGRTYIGFTLDELVGELSNRLLSKVRGREIDLGVALGEYRETASFVAGAMVKTAKSFSQLRRGDVSGALRTLTGRGNKHWKDIPGAASDAWLAYCYGLKPLVNEVASAVQVLEKGLRDPSRPVVVRSSITKSVSCYASKGFHHNQIEGSVRVSGKVEFWIDSPILYTLEQVGFINPLSVAWELVPFSFVVDWFIPIGDFLTNIMPPRGVTFVSGCITYRGDGKHKAWTAIDQPFQQWHTSMELRDTFKRRTPLLSFPRYFLKTPDLSLSKSQIANGLALLWQQLRK